MARKKLALKNDDVKHLSVPQYETLTISKVLEFAASYPGIEDHLPDARDLPSIPRQWIINICYSIIGQDFSDFVRE